MEEKWSIDKLDGNNYWSTWKFQMKHLLLARALWGLVDGSEALEGDASAERTAQFRLKSQKAFSTHGQKSGTVWLTSMRTKSLIHYSIWRLLYRFL